MNNPATARVSRKLAAAPDAVWHALTTPELMQQYFFGAQVESDFRVGSPIVWSGEFKGKPYQDKGEILVAEPGRRLCMTHWSALSGEPEDEAHTHVVDIELAPVSGGTRVTLTQRNRDGVVHPGDSEHRPEYERNWGTLLDGLAKTVEH